MASRESEHDAWLVLLVAAMVVIGVSVYFGRRSDAQDASLSLFHILDAGHTWAE